MGSLKRVFITGKGTAFELDSLTEEQLAEFSKMSPEAQKNYINKIVKELPKPATEYIGFCKEQQCQVALTTCIRCARNKGLTKLNQWDGCKQSNVTRL